MEKPLFFERIPEWLGGQNRRQPGVGLKEISAHVMAVLELDTHLSLSDLRSIQLKLIQLEERMEHPPAALEESIRAVEAKIEYLTFVREINRRYGLETTYEELISFIDTLPTGYQEIVDEFMEKMDGQLVDARPFERLFALHSLLKKHGKDWAWLKGKVSEENYQALVRGEVMLTPGPDGRVRMGWTNDYLPFE